MFHMRIISESKNKRNSWEYWCFSLLFAIIALVYAELLNSFIRKEKLCPKKSILDSVFMPVHSHNYSLNFVPYDTILMNLHKTIAQCDVFHILWKSGLVFSCYQFSSDNENHLKKPHSELFITSNYE